MSISYDGAIEISPALNAAEIRQYNAKVLDLVGKAYKPTHSTVRRLQTLLESPLDFRAEVRMGLEIRTTEREVPEGTLLVRTSSVLSPCSDGYSTTVTPESLVAALRETFPDHTLTGVVTSVDTDYNSAERVSIKGGKVCSTKGAVSVVWADGSTPTPLNDLT